MATSAASSNNAQPIADLVNKYRAELDENVTTMRRRAADVQRTAEQQLRQTQQTLADIEPTVKQAKADAQSTLQDMSPVDIPNYNKLLETFAWTAVMQAGSMAAAFGAGTLLYPLLGAIFSTSGAAVLAYGLLPALAFMHLRASTATDSDETTRLKLLAFAGVEGALTGYLLSNRYLVSAQPLALLTPLAIAVVSHQLGPQLGRERTTLLAALLGAGLGTHLVVGALITGLSFPTVLLSTLYTAVGFATLQFFFRYMAGDYTRSAHIYMYGYFVGALACQALVFFLFAGAKETMDIAGHAGHAAHNAANVASHAAHDAANVAKQQAAHAAEAAQSAWAKWGRK